jgi:hypothetical protein
MQESAAVMFNMGVLKFNRGQVAVILKFPVAPPENNADFRGVIYVAQYPVFVSLFMLARFIGKDTVPETFHPA